MEAAFQAGAGFSATQLALVVRGFVAALFVIWSIWVIYNQFKLVVTNQLTAIQWIFNSITTVVVLVMVLIIVGT
jgi:integrating conjugative element protein (TIGR03758 family)